MTVLVKVVEQDGTVVVADLENVNVRPIRWRLNEPTTGGLGFPKATPDAADIDLLDKEVQTYRTGDTNPRLWGPMISADASAGSAEVEVAVVDPFWYLLRRQVASTPLCISIGIPPVHHDHGAVEIDLNSIA